MSSDSPILELRGIHKSYGKAAAVAGVDLSLRRGEVFSLLGPSGCGKTTLLRLAAGFLSPDEGSVWLEGKDITHLPPNKRHLNTVFQQYALFPHLTVRQNIAFGPQVARRDKADIERRVGDLLELMELGEHAEKRPALLSGGQRQRVALARALINDPAVLLLDEPLGALDLKLRQRMMIELARIQRETETTFLYVTHDQSEAMTLSHRVAVMSEGVFLQVGSPREIYENPQTEFVASFIGDTHLLRGRISSTSPVLKADIPNFGEVILPADSRAIPGASMTLSLRPEILGVEPWDKPADGGAENRLPGILESVLFQGPWLLCTVAVGEELVPVLIPADEAARLRQHLVIGERVWLSWDIDQACVLWK